MNTRLTLLAGSMFLVIACGGGSLAASRYSPGTTANSSSPTTTSISACAGVGVPLMRIHIARDGSSSGDLLDTNASGAVAATKNLAWPAGYRVQSVAGVLTIVDSNGSVIASDGDTLKDLQACPTADGLALVAPFTVAQAPSSPDGRLLTGTPWPGWPTDHPCAASYLDTRLVEDPDSGIAGQSGGRHITIVWPYGYDVQSGPDGVELVDRNGNELAYVGEAIRVGGGERPDGNFDGCGEIEPLPVATPG